MNINKNRTDKFRSFSPLVLTLAALLPATLAAAQKSAATKGGIVANHAASKNVAAVSGATFVTMKLKGLECVSCAHQVQQGLMGVAGVKSAEVSVPGQTALVRFVTKNPPKNDALTAAVKKAGFGVTSIEKGKAAASKKGAARG